MNRRLFLSDQIITKNLIAFIGSSVISDKAISLNVPE